MSKILACSLFLGVTGLLIAAPISAQTPSPITGYQVDVLIAVTNTMVTRAIPLTAVTCNLASLPAPTSLVNPATIQWDDAAIVGRVCRASVGDFFSTLPPATGYNATLIALSADGPSPRSNLSNPFDVVRVPPAARTGVGVRQ